MQNFGALLSIFSSKPQVAPTEKQSSGEDSGFNKILQSLMESAGAEMLQKTGVSTGAQKLLAVPDGEESANEDMISAKVTDINEILENLIMQIKKDTPVADGELNFGSEEITAELESIFADFSASGATETEKMDAMIKYINGLVSAAESNDVQGETNEIFKDILTSAQQDNDAPEQQSKNNDNIQALTPELPDDGDMALADDVTAETKQPPVARNDAAAVSLEQVDTVTTNIQQESPKQNIETKLTQAEPTANQQLEIASVKTNEKVTVEPKSTEVKQTTAPLENATAETENIQPTDDDAVALKQQPEQSEKNTAPMEKNSRINVIESAIADSKKQPETAKPADTTQVEQKQEVKTTSTDQRESLRAETYNKSTLSSDAGNSGGQKGGGDSSAFLKSSANAAFEQSKSTDSNSETKGMTFDSAMKQTAETAKTVEAAEAQRAKPFDMTDAKDISRLINRIHSTAVKGESSLTVTLTPENLGRLEIRLTEIGGRLTAKLLADNESAHKLMVSNAEAIKSQLSEKGIVIDNMEFSFSDTAKQESNENKRASSKHSHKKMMKDDEGDTFELGNEIATNKDKGLYA